MAKGGHNIKSAEALRVHGTFRQDRHAHLDDAPQIAGGPEKPSWLSGEAEELWDLVVSCYGSVGPLTRLDTAMLATCCDLWGKYRAASDAAEKDPVDKDARIAVLGYFSAFEKAAGRLGLNPVDRRRLTVEASKPTTEDDELRSYFA